MKFQFNITEVETGKSGKGTIYSGIKDLIQDPKTFEVAPIVDYSFSFDKINDNDNNNIQIRNILNYNFEDIE